MSENAMNTKLKKSVFGELSVMSGGLIALMIGLIVVCIIIYAYMIQSPDKSVTIVDDAEIFSRSQEKELKKLAKELMDDKDINVVIVTTRDKADTIGSGYYSNSDEDCREFANDYYRSVAISGQFRDNSGICILVDLSLDYDGGRFFWLYTYGTAFYTINDMQAGFIFEDHRSTFKNGEYFEGLSGIIEDVDDYDFKHGTVSFMNGIVIIVPFILAFLLAFLITKKKKLDKAPKSREYLVTAENVQKTDGGSGSVDENGLSLGGILGSAAAGALAGMIIEDVFLNQRTVTTHHSSGGGGGGGFGGGGGGGHFGGGGGRF